MIKIISAFLDGLSTPSPKSHRQLIKGENKLRSHLKEKQIDAMIEDSFPASDPPSTY